MGSSEHSRRSPEATSTHQPASPKKEAPPPSEGTVSMRPPAPTHGAVPTAIAKVVVKLQSGDQASSSSGAGTDGKSSVPWFQAPETAGVLRHERRKMLQLLARLLMRSKAHRPEAPKLPLVARRLEEALLVTSGSLEAYADARTLRDRLRRVAKASERLRRGGGGTATATSSSPRVVEEFSESEVAVRETKDAASSQEEKTSPSGGPPPPSSVPVKAEATADRDDRRPHVGTADAVRRPGGGVSAVVPRTDNTGDDEEHLAETPPKATRLPLTLLDPRLVARAQIEAHVLSLTADDRRAASLRILDGVERSHRHSWLFAQPVDPVALDVPDYLDIVKEPMDLGTVRARVVGDDAYTLEAFRRDALLAFDNAILYNGAASEVGSVATEMRAAFETAWSDDDVHRAQQPEAEAAAHGAGHGERCKLCRKGARHFEQRVYRCDGPSCNGRAIPRRTASYYDASTRQRWCRLCFEKFPPASATASSSRSGSSSWQREEPLAISEPEAPEEPWVQCATCAAWVHQICGLVDGAVAAATDEEYHCPDCALRASSSAVDDDADDAGGAAQHPPVPTVLRARALPETDLSRFVEARLARAVPELAATATVREVATCRERHAVKPRFLARHHRDSKSKSSSSIAAVSRCLCLFQEIDGVDVLVFGAYLYEYGAEAGAPNARRVYVSYLDSVHYLRPRAARTRAYRCVLSAYLAHAKHRGFHTAHLWACPPKRGDSYLFYAHPKDQKTPSPDRLKKWYRRVLDDDAKAEGIVVSVSNFFDDHLEPALTEASKAVADAVAAAHDRQRQRRSVTSSATRSAVASKVLTRRGSRIVNDDDDDDDDEAAVAAAAEAAALEFERRLPYFEGDYWPGEAETVLEAMEEAEQRRRREAEKAEDPREDSDDDEDWVASEAATADAASARPSKRKAGPPNKAKSASKPKKPKQPRQKKRPRAAVHVPHKAPTNHEDDSLLARLARAMQPSKDTFIVAHLQPRAVADAMDLANAPVAEDASPATVVVDDDVSAPGAAAPEHLFRTRQRFLDVCVASNLQFDELRRAKHSTMTILTYLHRPETLAAAEADDASLEVDAPPTFGGGGGAAAAAASASFAGAAAAFGGGAAGAPGGGGPASSSPAGRLSLQPSAGAASNPRAEKARLLRVLLRILEHAAGCARGPTCAFPHCARMRAQLEHFATCRIPDRLVACRDCRRISTLLRLHARFCRKADCRVPHCGVERHRRGPDAPTATTIPTAKLRVVASPVSPVDHFQAAEQPSMALNGVGG